MVASLPILFGKVALDVGLGAALDLNVEVRRELEDGAEHGAVLHDPEALEGAEGQVALFVRDLGRLEV